MSNRDLLLRAAEIISEKGLCKSGPRDEKGHVCMVIALLEALRALGNLSPLSAPLPIPVIEKVIGSELITWTEKPGITTEDAVLAFKKAAEEA